MVEYNQMIEKLISSIISFDFEIDFEKVKNKMELREIPSEEIQKLEEVEIKQKFSRGEFKIKLHDGKIIDSNSIYKYAQENNIAEPLLILNPNFKYVRWEITEDLSSPQLRNEIKNMLSSNSEINLEKTQKALISAEIETSTTLGYIDEIAVKANNLVAEGKFYLRSSCSREDAVKLINEVIEELKLEKEDFVIKKMKTDKLAAIAYLLFILLVLSVWHLINLNFNVPKWLSGSIAAFLFMTPFILRVINFSFIDSIFFEAKARKKYEKEFNDKTR